MPEKVRDATFDIAKFVAIYMVILWHCYPAGWHASRWSDSLPVNLIIGCNMPLFFLISGYFARKMFVLRDWKALVIRLIGYLWPVFVFSIVDVLITSISHGASGGVLVQWIRVLVMCFWFFCCLSLCEIVTFLGFWIGRRRDVCVGWTLGIVFIIFWTIPLGVWYFVAMVPFYWGGVFLLHKIYDHPQMKVYGIMMLIAYVVISMVEGDITMNGMGFYWDRMRLSDPSWAGLFRMFARYVMGVLGAVGILMTIKTLLDSLPQTGKIAALGTTTLGVYFVHRYFVMGWYHVEGSSQIACYLLVCLAIIIFMLCHLIVLLTRRISVLNFVCWGPGRWIKKFLV